MNNREKAEEDLRIFILHHAIGHPSNCGCGRPISTLYWFMSWLDRHSRSEVTKEQIRSLLMKHITIHHGPGKEFDDFAEDLLSLINGKQECETCGQVIKEHKDD